jgi:uncharacterized ion transporter superfamily protein YfcC
MKTCFESNGNGIRFRNFIYFITSIVIWTYKYYNIANKQINKQTNRQTDKQNKINKNNKKPRKKNEKKMKNNGEQNNIPKPQ